MADTLKITSSLCFNYYVRYLCYAFWTMRLKFATGISSIKMYLQNNSIHLGLNYNNFIFQSNNLEILLLSLKKINTNSNILHMFSLITGKIYICIIIKEISANRATYLNMDSGIFYNRRNEMFEISAYVCMFYPLEFFLNY